MSVGVFGAEVDEGGARVDRTTRERCCFSPSLFRPLSFSVVLSPLFLSLRHSSLSPPSFACSVYLLSFSFSLFLSSTLVSFHPSAGLRPRLGRSHVGERFARLRGFLVVCISLSLSPSSLQYRERTPFGPLIPPFIRRIFPFCARPPRAAFRARLCPLHKRR